MRYFIKLGSSDLIIADEFPNFVPDANGNPVPVNRAEYDELVGPDLEKYLAATTQAGEITKAQAELLGSVAGSVLPMLVEAGEITTEQLAKAEFGFVNRHTTDELDGKGDNKWYLFGAGKTRHKGDTVMTKAEAVAQGIVIG